MAQSNLVTLKIFMEHVKYISNKVMNVDSLLFSYKGIRGDWLNQ